MGGAYTCSILHVPGQFPGVGECWLHHFLFTPQSHKKGSHVDGHGRHHVAQIREVYFKLFIGLKKSHKPPSPCSGEAAQVPSPDAEFQKNLVVF